MDFSVAFKNKHGEWEEITNESLFKDAMRYRWLRDKYAAGEETYLAEGIISADCLDEYIDEQINT